MKKLLIVAVFCLFFTAQPLAAETAAQLPQPKTSGGKPLMQALKERRTQRAFSAKALPDQLLANLLWAANGINRPGHRTAPSAQNMQEIDIYVARQDGLYRYEPEQNTLVRVSAEDIRAATGKQDFVKTAPVNLIYVADQSKMEKVGSEKEKYAAADTGFISANVYLFCASEGLATVVRGWFDEQELGKAMGLRPEQKIILTQTVGYPG